MKITDKTISMVDYYGATVTIHYDDLTDELAVITIDEMTLLPEDAADLAQELQALVDRNAVQ